MSEEKIIVTGHKNPDTDSICSSVAYTYLKNQTAGDHYVAGRAGEISPETAYVLKRFGIEAPELVKDASGRKVILVDHNETAQAVNGFENAELVEVVDHHKIGDIQTIAPIYFRCEPLGCTCTILTKMYDEAGVEIPEQIAGILLSAILSDTLAFRSPTCTDADVAAGKKLAEIAGVDADQLAEGMFEAGENLDGKTAEDICYSDFKIFEHDGMKFGVGQASFMSPANLQKAKDMLLPYLPETLAKDGTAMVFLMLTDIREQSSYVIFAGDQAEATLEKAFGQKKEEGEDGMLLEGVVSRKKQMIPPVLEALG